jgi:hypothetical protein
MYNMHGKFRLQSILKYKGPVIIYVGGIFIVCIKTFFPDPPLEVLNLMFDPPHMEFIK